MHLRKKNSAVLLLLGAILSGRCVSAEPSQPSLHAQLSAVAPIILQLELDRPLAATEKLQIQMFDSAKTPVLTIDASDFAERISWLEAQPDQEYQMRYRTLKPGADGATEAASSRWSTMQTTRTPPAPLSAPNSPANLQPTAITPFQVTLSWKDRSANEYGFVVRACEKEVCQDVARALPNFSEITIDGLLPEHAYNLAVHAYNSAGESHASNAVRVRTKPALEPTGAPMKWPDQNCTSRKALLTPIENVQFLSLSSEQISLPKGRFADVFDIVDQSDCHRAGCARLAYGFAGDCYRFLGEFKAVLGRDARGMPLFFSSYSSNAGSGSSELIQSSSRGAVVVASWEYGSLSEHLATLTYGWFAPTKRGAGRWWHGN